MKRILFISALLALFSFSGCKVQQTTSEEMEFLHKIAVEAMKNNDFVLEANYVTFRAGRTVFVSPNTNFIMLSGDRATVQLAFNSPHAGPNGIGGITVEGRASNIRIREGRNGLITFSMNVMGRGISATVTINMHPGTNQCTAVVNPNFNNQRITFMGALYPSEYSNVFRARSL